MVARGKFWRQKSPNILTHWLYLQIEEGHAYHGEFCCEHTHTHTQKTKKKTLRVPCPKSVSNLRFFIFLKFLYWSTVDLQCCVNFCCKAKGFSLYINVCIYVCILLKILFHFGLSQDIECNSLCSIAGLCCLSILCIFLVCVC